jgi:hypothetical protein
MTVKYHPIYSKDAVVHLETGDDKFSAMQRAIEVSQFFDNVEPIFISGSQAHQ